MNKGTIALLIGLGLIGAGLAMMYLDFRVREGQWIYITSRTGEEIPSEDFEIWRRHGALWALVGLFGAGVPLVGFGILDRRNHQRTSKRS